MYKIYKIVEDKLCLYPGFYLAEVVGEGEMIYLRSSWAEDVLKKEVGDLVFTDTFLNSKTGVLVSRDNDTIIIYYNE